MILSYASQRDYDEMVGKTDGAAPVWSPEDFANMAQFMGAFNERLADSGELVETRGLLDPARTRRVAAGPTPVVTDGPYAETEEVLAGYWIVECESLDRATAIAAELNDCPAPEAARARAYADVRPIAEDHADLG
ncbi:YciI family protein [Nocardia harenae]|uniref:YciI family protein n=1 Tax=Nocardia harenae TaxID=358707 RepID=UPI00082F1CFC|nr:YciI family protein [Nocardia harenae]